jgi:hypothetical protein
VRPDPTTLIRAPIILLRLSCSTPWTVLWSGCTCHPEKSVPSYSSMSLIRLKVSSELQDRCLRIEIYPGTWNVKPGTRGKRA